MSSAPLGSSSGLLHAMTPPHTPARRDWRATLAGLSTSLLVHGSILAIGAVLLVRQVPNLLPQAQEQTSTPAVSIEDGQQKLINPFANNGLAADPRLATLGRLDGEPELKAAGDSMAKALDAQTAPSSAIIGAGPVEARPFRTTGTGDGPAGMQLGRPDGLRNKKIDFVGLGTLGGPAAAKRVVFLCDATGTMAGLKFDLLKRELNSTVAKLDPVQDFGIVFFADAGAASMSKQLLPGTPASKRAASAFLDKFSPRGATNPLPGLEAAFALKPEVVYLLSDGEFDNLVAYDEVVAKVKALNAAGQVRVYTILFGDRDARAEQTLKQIASDNGGAFSGIL